MALGIIQYGSLVVMCKLVSAVGLQVLLDCSTWPGHHKLLVVVALPADARVPVGTLLAAPPPPVEFGGLPPLILFFNMSTGWFGRFVLSTECYRTRKLDYNDLNWPRCSAQVTESLALTDGGFCQKQTLYISDCVKIVSL